MSWLMIPWQLGVQQNAAMYSNAHAWMQTFDCCCKMNQRLKARTKLCLTIRTIRTIILQWWAQQEALQIPIRHKLVQHNHTGSAILKTWPSSTDQQASVEANACGYCTAELNYLAQCVSKLQTLVCWQRCLAAHASDGQVSSCTWNRSTILNPYEGKQQQTASVVGAKADDNKHWW